MKTQFILFFFTHPAMKRKAEIAPLLNLINVGKPANSYEPPSKKKRTLTLTTDETYEESSPMQLPVNRKLDMEKDSPPDTDSRWGLEMPLDNSYADEVWLNSLSKGKYVTGIPLPLLDESKIGFYERCDMIYEAFDAEDDEDDVRGEWKKMGVFAKDVLEIDGFLQDDYLLYLRRIVGHKDAIVPEEYRRKNGRRDYIKHIYEGNGLVQFIYFFYFLLLPSYALDLED